ncbi:MAG: hypothetical protein AAGA03_16110 [Planctomycetota bacterium]
MTFTIKVPATDKVSATEPTVDVAGLEALPPPPPIPSPRSATRPVSAGQPAYRHLSTAPAHRSAGRGLSASRKSAKSSSKLIAVLAVGLVVAIGSGVALIGGWLWLRAGNTIPSIASITTSLAGRDALLKQVDQIDRQAQTLAEEVRTHPGGAQAGPLLSRVGQLKFESIRLMLSVSQVSPTTDSTEGELTLEEQIEGPVDDDQADELIEAFNEWKVDDSRVVGAQVRTSLRHADESRRYLLLGHVPLASPSTDAEKIVVARINTHRLLHKAIGNALRDLYATQLPSNIDPKNRAFADEWQKRYVAAMEQVEPRIEEYAKLLEGLAEQQFVASKRKQTPPEQYQQSWDATRQFTYEMLNAVGLSASFVDSRKAMQRWLIADQSIDRAAAGVKPPWVADRMAAQKQAEDENRLEAERQRNVAQQQRRERERIANQTSGNAEKRQDPSIADRPGNASEAFRSDRMRNRPPFSMGQGRQPRRNPGQPAPGADGFENRFGTRGFGNRPPMQPIDPKTGVTIQMADANGLDTRTLSQQLQASLGGRISVSISNGQLTARLSYTGSVRDVVDAIGFGKVTEVDEAKRLITVVRRER